jgi:hypothetical protein
MKATFNLILIASLTGCAGKQNIASISGAAPALPPVDYVVGDWTSGEACGTYIFAFNLSSRGDYGSIATGLPSLPFSGPTVEESNAMYDAITKTETATSLYAPRIHTSITGIHFFGIPLFAKRCVKVNARAITIKDGPIPWAK